MPPVTWISSSRSEGHARIFHAVEVSQTHTRSPLFMSASSCRIDCALSHLAIFEKGRHFLEAKGNFCEVKLDELR